MRVKGVYIVVFAVVLVLPVLYIGCNLDSGSVGFTLAYKTDKAARTLSTRYPMEEGYERIACTEESFGAYLRNLPLKPYASYVTYYNGETKQKANVYDAVVDLEIGQKNLQQCADAVIRLRAEYLFSQKRFGDIHFNFTNGFKAEYLKWRMGWRIRVKGNTVSWVKQAPEDHSYKSFRQYLDVVFTYAGTLSLAKELKPKAFAKMQCGDVFIQGGSPGHAVLVTDMMVNKKSGQKFFMLVQSYMPAQDIQVLLNAPRVPISKAQCIQE